MIVHTILYVADQKRSSELYSEVLGIVPTLDVPGMTEFKFSEQHVLGLMPERGIKRLLGAKLPDPAQASGTPRAELYFRIEEPEQFQLRAIELGMTELSPIQPRDWDDRAGYVLDPDGHVLAFASSLSK
jgi:catechol 2,3-dioxygenase-like lactoylglutathione lyase family enzyme